MNLFQYSKCSFFSLLFFLLIPLLSAASPRPLVEVKGGYFFFADQKMRSIYREGGWDVQLSCSLPLKRFLQLYTSVEYLQAEGYSLGAYEKTRLWQLPVTVGLKAAIPISNLISYYATVGPRYFHIHVNNHSSFVDKNLTNNGVGGFLGTGFLITPYRCLVIDLFGEYSYEKTRFYSSQMNVFTRNIQIGGFVFGGGLGYLF